MEESSPLPSLRSRVVNGFIAILLLLIGFIIVAGREAWPICNYPMFEEVVPAR